MSAERQNSHLHELVVINQSSVPKGEED